MARPSILNERLITEFCAYVRMGCPIDTACQLSGLSRPTFYRWKQAYENGRARGLHRQFFRELDVAQAQAVQLCVSNILAAGKKNWTAHAWFLERVMPAQFGRKRIYDTPPREDSRPEEIEVTDEERAAIKALYAARQQKRGSGSGSGSSGDSEEQPC